MIYIIQTDLKMFGKKKVFQTHFFMRNITLWMKRKSQVHRCIQWTQSNSQTIDIRKRSKRK